MKTSLTHILTGWMSETTVTDGIQHFQQRFLQMYVSCNVIDKFIKACADSSHGLRSVKRRAWHKQFAALKYPVSARQMVFVSDLFGRIPEWDGGQVSAFLLQSPFPFRVPSPSGSSDSQHG